jgi:hypothetical protein
MPSHGSDPSHVGEWRTAQVNHAAPGERQATVANQPDGWVRASTAVRATGQGG